MMPDTGEDCEIRQRVNAKEAEIKTTEIKMRQTMESAEGRTSTRPATRKNNKTPVRKDLKTA